MGRVQKGGKEDKERETKSLGSIFATEGVSNYKAVIDQIEVPQVRM